MGVFVVVIRKKNKIKEIYYSWTAPGMIISEQFCKEFYNEKGLIKEVQCFSDTLSVNSVAELKYYYSQTELVRLVYWSKRLNDSIDYNIKDPDNQCFQDQTRIWKLCFDSTYQKVIGTYLYGSDVQKELDGEFIHYNYNNDSILEAELYYEGISDQILRKSYYEYTQWDENSNWTERKVYVNLEHLGDDDGINIYDLSEEEQYRLFNTFPSGPEELNDKEPFIQTRTIVYE